MSGSSDNWITELIAPLQAAWSATPTEPLGLPAIPHALEAALLLGLATHGDRSLIWISDGPHAMDLMCRNLRTLDEQNRLSLYAYPPGSNTHGNLSAVFAARDRLTTLVELASKPQKPILVLTCIEAVIQPCPTPDSLRRNHRKVQINDDWERDELTDFLQRTGHRFVSEVQEPGEAAVRGGIVDIWPIRESHPFRIELFGSTIESIRIFDPTDQRSIAARPALHIGLAVEGPAANGRFPDTWPASAAIIWSRYPDIVRHLKIVSETSAEAQAYTSPEAAVSVTSQPEIKRPGPDGAAGTPSQNVPAVMAESAEPHPQIYLPAPESMAPAHDLLPDDIRFIEGVTAPSDDGFQPDAVDRQRRAFVQRLVTAARAGTVVSVYFNTSGALTHFRKSFHDQLAISSIQCKSGWLSDGFYLPQQRRMIVSEDLLYGRGKKRRLRPAPTAIGAGEDTFAGKIGQRLTDWNALNPGDLVVHARHGIGRYLGLQAAEREDTADEYLIVAYADEARLFVPATQAHLLSRYIGAPRHGVRLHKLGGTRWNRERHAAAQAIEDLAASFVELQAARQTLAGHAFSADTPWLHDFEAAFPFDETADQSQAIADVLRDMQAPRPMDRLICGDAGYGKTEVAMRAAFKAVMDGKQVTVFVPTTVLAQQHYYTFTERMGPYPVMIEMLSRFSSTEDRRRVRDGLRSGAIDIIIGTHALLNTELEFKDLGLVIIDEEQRFGVMHKERFKHIRRMVDVLTLTATPIPRTLYLSLTGVRELSAIRTPPRDRLAIETEIAEDRNDVIRHAVLRELRRDGQVFFLHNRVQSIERMHTRLRQLIPEARIEVAHGQMPARALSDKMRRFGGGHFDVLLCTTIIESGVDIPAANTMIVDRADRFGLAELYQLRGRVGRSGIRAHAVLLLPRHGLTDPQARKRVGALKDYAHPGAGFELALRDLEIRGAGNLLGSEQSGHITAIGFNLYCQLLQRTVARLKGEPVPPLVDVTCRLDFLRDSDHDEVAPGMGLPADYVGDEQERMRLYRRLAEFADPQQIAALRKELRDRFGPLPGPVERLLALSDIRLTAAVKGVQSVETDGPKVMLQRDGNYVMPGGRLPRLRDGSIDKRLHALRELLDTI